jgi:hypothetical protein
MALLRILNSARRSTGVLEFGRICECFTAQFQQWWFLFLLESPGREAVPVAPSANEPEMHSAVIFGSRTKVKF